MARGRMAAGRRLTSMILLASILVQFCGIASAQNCGTQGGGAVCQSGNCCSTYGYCGTTSDYCGSGNCQSQCPSSPPSSGGVGSVVTSSVYDSIFPNKNSFYTYSSFISACNSFPAFGTTGSATAQKQDIAAFLAHVSHETGGLVYISEIDQSSNYCDSMNTQYPCAAGKSYYGRGPLQISWNYNYGPAGNAIGQNLLANPDLVASDPVVSWQTALWFWTTAQSPKPACHDVMDGSWTPSASDTAAGRTPGFGVTIDIINGKFECGPNASNPSEATDRVNLYTSICGTLGVATGSNLVCSSMQPYPS